MCPNREDKRNGMATGQSSLFDRRDRQSELELYKNLLITPMNRQEGEPLIDKRHILDALIVAFVVFFSVLLGDIVLTGDFYLTTPEIFRRLPTAGIAFGLTFMAQWARARGLDARDWLIDFLE